MFPFPPVVRSFLFSLFERAWLRTALCFCLCATVCASCSVDRHMEKKAGELMARMDAVPDRLPRKEISWHQALAMMMERNIDLKKSEQSLKTTKRSVINVFTQIIPGVNLDWMLTKELSDLAKVTASDVEYNTNILFNMPSLTQIPFDYYSASQSSCRNASGKRRGKDAGDEKKGAGGQIVPAGAFLPECADQLQ